MRSQISSCLSYKAWRERDLDAIYPIVWLDAIHYKIKENGRYVSKAIYTILGLNIEGKKELLGLYLSDQEGAHHWLSVLTECLSDYRPDRILNLAARQDLIAGRRRHIDASHLMREVGKEGIFQ